MSELVEMNTYIYNVKTVYTKEELIETLKKRETTLVKGTLASAIRKRYEPYMRPSARQPMRRQRFILRRGW